MNKRDRRVQRVLQITLVLNLVVMIMKLTVSWYSGSLSLFVDALHSMTDSFNNILGLAANHAAAAEPDREHPYGHQKFEALGALAIAAFLGVTCLEIVRGAIDRILHGSRPVQMSGAVLWVMLVVLGINILVVLYERNVGKRTKSQILLADAADTMSDIWVTMVVIIGLVGVWLGHQWLDVVLAFPVGVLVLKSGWEILRNNLPWLVDEMAIDPKHIHRHAMSVAGVAGCRDITSRGLLGRQAFIEMRLVVTATEVDSAHKIVKKVENLLKAHYQPVRIAISIEPLGYCIDNNAYS
jgi:cation diffusion facilitator family transporter